MAIAVPPGNDTHVALPDCSNNTPSTLRHELSPVTAPAELEANRPPTIAIAATIPAFLVFMISPSPKATCRSPRLSPTLEPLGAGDQADRVGGGTQSCSAVLTHGGEVDPAWPVPYGQNTGLAEGRLGSREGTI